MTQTIESDQGTAARSSERASILLVDDQAANLLVLRTVLQELGENLVEVRSGEEALLRVQQEEFAVVLLDVQMPGLDGFDTARLIRERELQQARHTPIIFLTAYDVDRPTMEKAYALGAVDFLVKPIVPVILTAKVAGFVDLFAKTQEVKRQAERIRQLDRTQYEEKLAEENARLVRQKEQFRVTLASIGDAVIAADADGQITFMNAVASALTGWTLEDARGVSLSQVFRIHDEATLRDLQNAAVRALRESRVVEHVNHSVLVAKDGSEHPVSHNAAPIRDESGSIVGVVLVFRDMTQSRRLEERYRQTQKMEAIGRLAGGVAHDFNNLLTVILGYCECLQEETTLTSDQSQSLQLIHEAGERAAGLTRQLLAFSRQQILQLKVLDLNSVVTETGKLLERLIGEDVTLTIVSSGRLAPVRVDEGQIQQVLMNLALNARDAMPHGGKLTIETANIDLDEHYAQNHPNVKPGRHVVLSVSDTGCGMDDNTKARIFEPFFTTKEAGKGTGLGLATVFGIVEQSGGHITVYSEPDKGTTFRVYFPVVESTAEAKTENRSQPVLQRGTETVMVVEDEELVRKFACRVLRSQGYVVLEAANGLEALQVFEQHPGQIHLLVTDVVMPELSGRALCERLYQHYPGLSVLFMSGYTDDAVVRHGILEAQTDFLQKPFAPAVLAQKVREILDR